MDLIGTAIGLAILIVVGIPVLAGVLALAVSALALQMAVGAAVIGYLVGIPWSIWFRLTHGRWPE